MADMEHGAIILCGGKSTRMGRDKATLPFGTETMLQRVVRRMSQVVSTRRMVIVAAENQSLPDLPSDVVLARDARQGRGPLEGLAAGLAAVPTSIDAVYATSCDVPLLVPAFVEAMFRLMEEPDPSSPRSLVGERAGERGSNSKSNRFDIVVPRDGEHHHPLAAVYRRTVLGAIEELLADDRLRPRFLFDFVRTREVPVNDLRSVDPDLDTLRNLNTPAEYAAALLKEGIHDNPDRGSLF